MRTKHGAGRPGGGDGGGTAARPAAARRAGALAAAMAAALLGASSSDLLAQGSTAALRFWGTGSGQQDRVRIPIDDNAPGPDASAPCDVGAGSFTIEFWIRGVLADNPTANGGGDLEFASFNWIEGNIVVDRDIFGGSEADWGISVAGGFVRFGTGRGAAATDAEHTLEGSTNVLDDTWRHVAVVRDASTGRKRIYVDGLLDFESAAGVSTADLSYPNAGVPGQSTPWGPYIVLGAEKHDAGPEFPSFTGFLDEVRIWNVALQQTDLLDLYDRVVAVPRAGLVGWYRFEEGSGTTVADGSGAGSPAGTLIAGVPGNGEWSLLSQGQDRAAPVSSGPLPGGFQKTTIATGLTEPTVIEFAPDGRLFVGERGGRIKIVQGGVLLTTPLVQIPVATANGERGLVGLTLDPAFATNGYLYAYYTSSEPRNRVGRFTVVGNTATLASQVVIWQNPQLAADWHHGGAISFGPDGNLYIATGDQFDSTRSQPLTNQHGKLLRVRPDGTVPPDNPFIDVPGAHPQIWANGLRNPFRTFWDLPSGRLYIGDVGGNSDTSWEEINLGASGANYGWPAQEGPVCYAPPCTAYTFPWHTWRHDDTRYYSGAPGGAIVMGPVYRATAFPEAYRGSLFLGDYANRWIRRIAPAAAGAPAGDPTFLANPEAGTIVDLEVGPDGALYYVTVGVPWTGAPDVGAVHRIAWVAAGNQPPIAGATADVTSGPTPLTVQFSGATSSDPDGGPSPMTYDWRFGDGAVSTVRDPVHVYSDDGPYTVELRVGDGLETSAPASLAIAAGRPPTGAIGTPPPGTTYRAGDLIAYSGSGSDPDDGPLGAAAFSWQVIMRHNAHVHPFLGPIEGVTGGQFGIPDTGHGPEGTAYEILLTVSDSSGLTDARTRPLTPVTSSLTFSTSPPGISLTLDGEPTATPRSYASLERFRHLVDAPATFNLDGTPWQFQCWSDGGARVHEYVAPPGGGSLTAAYGATAQGPPVPGEAGGLVFAANAATISWSAVPGAVSYDLLRGTVGRPFAYNHSCLASGIAGASAADAAVPPAGSVYYYLARGRNACGPGTLGMSSAGTPRPAPSCP